MFRILFFLLAIECSGATNFVDKFDDNIKMYAAPNLDARTTNIFHAPTILGGSRKVIVDYDETHWWAIQRRYGLPLWPYYSLFIGEYELKGDWEVKTVYWQFLESNCISLSTGPSWGVPATFEIVYNRDDLGLFYSPVSQGHQFLNFRARYDHLTNFWVYLKDSSGAKTTVNYNFNGQLFIDYQESVPLYDFYPVNLESVTEIGLGIDDKVSVDGSISDVYFWGPNIEYGDCEGKVKSLKMIWMGSQSDVILIARSSAGRGASMNIVYSGTVTNKQEVFISGETINFFKFKKTLGVEVALLENGVFVDSVHTSCSEPIGYGTILGKFFVIEAIDSKGNYLILPPK